MNFERGKDAKEILKIGRKANAISIRKFEAIGSISFPLDRNRLTEKIVSKYNLRGKSSVDLFHGFYIEGSILVNFLRILERWGICKDFDDYIVEFGIRDAFKNGNYPKYADIPIVIEDMSFKLNHVLIITQEFISISEEIGDVAQIGKTQLSFSLTGKDLLYQDQLYKIAEPKDGY
jgi:hypothetical protein